MVVSDGKKHYGVLYCATDPPAALHSSVAEWGVSMSAIVVAAEAVAVVRRGGCRLLELGVRASGIDPEDTPASRVPLPPPMDPPGEPSTAEANDQPRGRVAPAPALPLPLCTQTNENAGPKPKPTRWLVVYVPEFAQDLDL